MQKFRPRSKSTNVPSPQTRCRNSSRVSSSPGCPASASSSRNGCGAHGEEHAGCANGCISRDVPAGFLTEDGTLYLLVNEKMNSVKEKVAGKAGKKLTATGRVVERSGMKVLQLITLE